MSRKITLNQVDALNAVINHKSITVAARNLNLTQPAVSISIKQLEKQYDAALLEMVNKKLTPTALGKIVYEYTQKIAQTINELETAIANYSGTLQGELTIAMVSTAKFFIPRILNDFLKEHTKVNPKLFLLNRQDVLQMIEDNSCDFAIMSQVPQSPTLLKHSFASNPLVIIAAPNHPLAIKKQLNVTDIQDESLIVRETGSGIRDSIEKLFSKYQCIPKIKMELSSTEAIKQVVAAEMGIGLVPKLSIANELASQKLVILNVKDTPIMEEWHFAFAKGKKATPIMTQFMQYVSQNIKEYI